MEQYEWYAIDWSKIKTFEDIVKILKLIDAKITNFHPSYNDIKDYLIKDEIVDSKIPSYIYTKKELDALSG